MYLAKVYSIFIASPGDTIEERHLLVERINFWNTINSRVKQVVLLPIMYETHGLSRVNLPPQETINKMVLENADYVVAIFFSTLGLGGTIEEIDEAVKLGIPTSLFFSKMNIPQAQIQTANEVLQFKKKHSDKSFYHEFEDHAEFTNKIDRELNAFINQRLDVAETRTIEESFDEEPERINLGQLSQKSKAILAVVAKTNSPLRVQDFGGRFQIDSHDQTIFMGFDRREWAYWKKAVEDLLEGDMLEYLKSISHGDVYELTTVGWEVALALDYEDFDQKAIE